MAGTITISTLSDGTNSTSATNIVRGACYARVQFNGTASTVTAAYNVSSITTIGTGDWEINYTTPFADTNYSVSGMGGQGTTGYGFLSSQQSAYSTTSVRVQYCVHNGSVQNGTQISVQVIGI